MQVVPKCAQDTKQTTQIELWLEMIQSVFDLNVVCWSRDE